MKTTVKIQNEKINVNNSKRYYSADELAEMLGISLSSSYKIIRQLNVELKEQNYLVIPGKVPCAYFEKRWYGHGA